jgi:hypothetical protein
MRSTLTPEARAKAKAARAANIASTPATTRPGSETTSFHVGDKVRVNRTDGRSRNWGRYDGRNGWVASINTQTFPSGSTYVEIGVCWFQPANWAKVSAETWFRTDELVPT